MKEAAVREVGVARSDQFVMLLTSEDSCLLERAQLVQTSMVVIFIFISDFIQ